MPVLPLIVTGVLAALAAVPVGARWLRVAQREHYIAPWVTRMAGLWLARSPLTAALGVVALVLAVVSVAPVASIGAAPVIDTVAPWAAVASVVLTALLPLGLPVRGRSAPFAFTVRARRLLAAWVVLHALVAVALALLLGAGGIALTLLASAPLTDLALVIMAPVEKGLSRKYVVSARTRLQKVRPKIVAITGSYGKTSTKAYVAHLLSNAFSTVASPASFNNLLGLSRAVNDRVVPGVQVFVAEMGVYGEGEIRELTRSFPPDIAAITTIGEAHLARMGSREVIARAKSEIVERAATVVLPIDEPELTALAERCRTEGKRVITVSVRPDAAADVTYDAGRSQITIRSGGSTRVLKAELPATGHAVNLVVAVGIALAAGVEPDDIAPRLTGLPGAQHRSEVQHAPSGAVIIDDTYNANPVGSTHAVETAGAMARERGGPLVVVTPGMVELGRMQAQRNRELGAAVAAAGGALFTVGRTNAAALAAGAGAGAAALAAGAGAGAGAVRAFPDRQRAVAAALDSAGDRGVILYENDLPDHYP